MDESVKRTYRRELDRHGKDIDLILKTKSGENEYGESYDESTVTVTGRVRSRSQPLVDRSQQDASDAGVDVTVYVKDTVSGITDGGGRNSTEIDVDQDGDGEFIVLYAHDQDNGLLRLECERL